MLAHRAVASRRGVGIVRNFWASSGQFSFQRSFATEEGQSQLKKTALYDLHLQHGAKMAPFCGWDMPVTYSSLSVSDSHLHTREAASLFDVSHMGQLRITGNQRNEFIEGLVVGDIKELGEGQARLSCFTNTNGGIIDDTVITNAGDHLYVVINAGCADKDIAHLNEALKAFKKKGGDVDLHVIQDHSLLALQGPKAAQVLSKFFKDDLSKLAFMSGKNILVNGIPCRVTRCGYTGEDGFEVSVPHKKVVDLASALLGEGTVQPAGLAARDSLRMEACLCLYGNDIDETTTPVEAGLAWAIGKRRRAEGGFLGSDVILKQLKEGVSRKRVGFLLQEGLARAHAPIYHGDKEVSQLSSGGWSPSLKKGIGMGYLPSQLAQLGTSVQVEVRNKKYPAIVSKMPLVPTHYYKGPEDKGASSSSASAKKAK